MNSKPLTPSRSLASRSFSSLSRTVLSSIHQGLLRSTDVAAGAVIGVVFGGCRLPRGSRTGPTDWGLVS